MPSLDDPRHEAFTKEVKLEPFARALREMSPQVWFTALRAPDTAVRAQMEPVSINPDGLIKGALRRAAEVEDQRTHPLTRQLLHFAPYPAHRAGPEQAHRDVSDPIVQPDAA